MRFATIIEGALPRGGIAIFHPILVKDHLRHRVRRTAVPPSVMVEIEPDCRDGARPDIGTAPAAAPSQEFSSDFEF